METSTPPESADATQAFQPHGEDSVESVTSQSSVPVRGRARRGSLEKAPADPAELRLLIIDDDVSTLKIASKLLNHVGYEHVTLISSGADAIELMKTTVELKQKGITQQFDLVMSDIHMPGIDGFEVLREVRKLDPEITFYMMSGTEDLDLVYRCLKLGADHYIIKPLTLEQTKGLWQSLYKTRKEKEMMQELDAERKRAASLKTHADRLESEAERLQSLVVGLQADVTQAVELPVSILTQELEKLLHHSNLPGEVVLSTVLKQLNKVALYRPAFDKLLGEKDMEPSTRQWLLKELDPAATYDRLYRVEADVGTSTEESHFQGWPKLESMKLHETLRSWDFDVWSMHEDQLLPMIVDMMTDFGLLEKFRVPEEKLHHFLLEVKDNYYKKNPYHSFRHAFDVTQTVYLLLTTCNAAELLNNLEIFALFIAAIVHDVGHPGVGNSFQYATMSPLAIQYNDRSILENFHCTSAFKLLSKPENDIFQGLTREQRRDVRSHIITAVLATDLAHHHAILNRLNTKILSGEFTKDDKECRTLMLEVLLKCADISNPGKPFSSAKYWANMVQEEFFYQGDMEAQRGLTISPFMDRAHPQLPRMQLNFIEYLVVPLFDALKQILPKMEHFCVQLQENRKLWLMLMETEQQKENEAKEARLKAEAESGKEEVTVEDDDAE